MYKYDILSIKNRDCVLFHSRVSVSPESSIVCGPKILNNATDWEWSRFTEAWELKEILEASYSIILSKVEIPRNFLAIGYIIIHMKLYWQKFLPFLESPFQPRIAFLENQFINKVHTLSRKNVFYGQRSFQSYGLWQSNTGFFFLSYIQLLRALHIFMNIVIF